MDTKIYPRYAAARAKKSPIVKDCLIAFVSGGIICTAGQGLLNFYRTLGLSQENAGTVVPITGFANAISSAAIDNKTEGLILGVGSKIFSVAGPVILYGISAGFVYGVIYWLLTTFIL